MLKSTLDAMFDSLMRHGDDDCELYIFYAFQSAQVSENG
jgi:hypothetical protein